MRPINSQIKRICYVICGNIKQQFQPKDLHPVLKLSLSFDKLLAVIFEHITVPGLPVTNVQRVALISTEVGGN